jgi:hypothetical protein
MHMERWTPIRTSLALGLMTSLALRLDEITEANFNEKPLGGYDLLNFSETSTYSDDIFYAFPVIGLLFYIYGKMFYKIKNGYVVS